MGCARSALPQAFERLARAGQLCYIVAMTLATPARSPDLVEPPRFARLADRFGATASLLCAIHCMALPFVLTVLPVFGLEFLGSHVFERGFIAFASVFASAVLLHGYRRHRQASALVLLAGGLVLLWIGGFGFDAGSTPWTHAILVASGGSGVAFAHVTNLRLGRLHAQRKCSCVAPPAIV